MNVLNGRACAFLVPALMISAGVWTLACGPGVSKSAPDPRVAQGRRHYLIYGCAACHGSEGKGDGPAAASLRVPPRDFRKAGAFRQGHSAEAIARTIAEGVPASGAMPASPFIPADERLALGLYIRSLATERD